MFSSIILNAVFDLWGNVSRSTDSAHPLRHNKIIPDYPCEGEVTQVDKLSSSGLIDSMQSGQTPTQYDRQQNAVQSSGGPDTERPWLLPFQSSGGDWIPHTFPAYSTPILEARAACGL